MHPGKFSALGGALLLVMAMSRLSAQEAKVVEKAGQVVVTKAGGSPGPAAVGTALVTRDRLGTGEESRAVLQMSPRWLARVDEETDIEILPGAIGGTDKDAVRVALGGLFVFSREEEGELKIVTPSATGGLRGTQLVVRVDAGGKTFMQVLEGEVELANDHGQVLLAAGEAGEAEPGQAPRRTAVIQTHNLLQWALYYPGVLPLEEIGLTADEARKVERSLKAYREGDLLGALESLPADFSATTDGARAYRAAVLLATGRVGGARRELDGMPAGNHGRRTLERLIAAVLLEETTEPTGDSAGEALAESYYLQSRRELGAARMAARRATELRPDFGYAWTRLAEMEFSFGNTQLARAALERGLELSPRNAQAHALKGFLLSAENRIPAAEAAFAEAVRLDGGLGNGWLGLGLTKIRRGRVEEGRRDLQTAATVEPTRAFLFSYHGNALSLEGEEELARKDLAHARELDPRDPTAWLYSALQQQQANRYNTAIADLHESARLNDNRQVYRSSFLLDQDRAVRSANLASIYQNNGMTALAVREATRAVESDYTSASAHLFLANSFNALRDPQRLHLRYETAWFNELLLAHLLSPVGSGPLSQFVSQQEYSKLFAADGVGGNAVAEFRDAGYVDFQGTLYTTQGRFSTGVDYGYHRDPGNRPNADVERHEVFWQMKYEVSPSDLLYALVHLKKQQNGDLHQSYANDDGNVQVRYEERNEPGLALVGWNHRWGPGVQTLFLGGRLAAHENLVDPHPHVLLRRDPNYLVPGFVQVTPSGQVVYTSPVLRDATVSPVGVAADGTVTVTADFLAALQPFLGKGSVAQIFQEMIDSTTQRQFEIYTGEIQHLWQTDRNTLLVGGRWQAGDFGVQAQFDPVLAAAARAFPTQSRSQAVTLDFERQSLYAYDYFRATPRLTLIAGVAQDWLVRPRNFRAPPVSSEQVEQERLNGKFGFTFIPTEGLKIRGVYAESLGGVTMDENVRLEPVQLAGFNQAFRTVISESLAGSIEAPVYKNWGLTMDGGWRDRTWWGVTFNRLTEDVERELGFFDILALPNFPGGRAMAIASSSAEQLAYAEDTWSAEFNHLIGNEFSVGLDLRYVDAALARLYPQIPTAVTPDADIHDRAVLREARLSGNWNSPRGWFARAEASYHSQHLASKAAGVATVPPPGDSFWQLNIQAGLRFDRNRREVSVGVLNLGDRDYHLSPLTSTHTLPQRRTVFIRCRAGF